MKTLPITRPTLDDPLYSQKNPYQTFLLVLSVAASLPLLRGHPGSAILERQLSSDAVLLWGLCLLAGSLVALVGEFWPGHTWVGLIFERAGIGLVAVAALVYATVVWGSVGGTAAVADVGAWGTAGGLAALLGFLSWATMQPPSRPSATVGRGIATAVVGFAFGTYLGVVWNLTPKTAGVAYVVSIQLAWALSCGWRVWQISKRLRWIRQLLAEVEAGEGG